MRKTAGVLLALVVIGTVPAFSAVAEPVSGVRASRVGDECPGKTTWPELVGEKGKRAKATIKRENRHISEAVIVPDGTAVTHDFRCDRVRIWVDKANIVVRSPTIG